MLKKGRRSRQICIAGATNQDPTNSAQLLQLHSGGKISSAPQFATRNPLSCGKQSRNPKFATIIKPHQAEPSYYSSTRVANPALHPQVATQIPLSCGKQSRNLKFATTISSNQTEPSYYSSTRVANPALCPSLPPKFNFRVANKAATSNLPP